MAKFNAKSQGKKKSFSKGKKPVGGGVKKKEESTKAKPLKNVNPFEIKVNKQKFQILGRPTKHETGLPGVSRARAIKKRQNTLLVEHKDKFKSNKFVDRRLGEKNPELSVEEKMEMRFFAEKIKSQNKKSKFLLGDDEILTHKGQTLADVEKYDDPRSDDEEDEIRLGKSFVSDAHFGGGILKKSDESEEKRQDRESLIDNLIAESKKRKDERQKEKEETEELTDKLDLEFRQVLDVISGIRTPKKSEVIPQRPPDTDYDILVRELHFVPRVKPGDKLKSPEEIARIEKEKLEKLEADRLKRMKGDIGVTKTMPHRSADDLDDGFVYQPPQREEKASFSTMDAGEPDLINAAEEGEENDEDEDESEEEGSDDDDSFSDLASSDEGEETENVKSNNKKQAENAAKKPNGDMPFVFKVPAEYEEFNELLRSYDEKEQRVVLERMIKSNHPALGGANKPNIEKIFAFLMQYIHDLASDGNLHLLNDLTPVVFDLATQLVPSATVASILLDVLMEKREELPSLGKKRNVSLATLVFLKLTALIFPTSDFRHPVTTPAFHLLIEALSRPVVNLQAIQIGLGLCAVAYEFVSLSKRYIPEVIHFLRGLIRLAVPRPLSVADSDLVYPFRPVDAESQLLVVTGEDTASITAERIKLADTNYDDQFRVAALSTGVRLLADFFNLWSDLPSAIDIFSPACSSLRKLPLERYNSQLGESVKSLVCRLEELEKKSRKRLMQEAKKPKPLRLYEPAFEEHYDGRKKRVGSQEKLESDKLKHKLKREMKGAIREIRKDNAFIGRQKIKEQIEKDNERKRKVKELLSSLAEQEGEVRKMKKTKKK